MDSIVAQAVDVAATIKSGFGATVAIKGEPDDFTKTLVIALAGALAELELELSARFPPEEARNVAFAAIVDRSEQFDLDNVQLTKNVVGRRIIERDENGRAFAITDVAV